MRRPPERETTPEARLARVITNLNWEIQGAHRHDPGFGDYRDALRPYLERELLRARAQEARECGFPERAQSIEHEIP